MSGVQQFIVNGRFGAVNQAFPANHKHFANIILSCVGAYAKGILEHFSVDLNLKLLFRLDSACELSRVSLTRNGLGFTLCRVLTAPYLSRTAIVGSGVLNKDYVVGD